MFGTCDISGALDFMVLGLTAVELVYTGIKGAVNEILSGEVFAHQMVATSALFDILKVLPIFV